MKTVQTQQIVAGDTGLFTTNKGVIALRYAVAQSKKGCSHLVIVNDGAGVKTSTIPDAAFTAHFTAIRDSVITAAHLFLRPPNNIGVDPDARQLLELMLTNEDIMAKAKAVAEEVKAEKTKKFASTAPAAEKANKAKNTKAPKDPSEKKVGVTRNFVLTSATPEEGVKATELIQVGVDALKKNKGSITREQLTAAIAAKYPDATPEDVTALVGKCKRRMVRKGFAEVEETAEAAE